MRKLFLCALAQVMAVAAFSQVNVQLHYDLGKATNPDSEDGRQPITTTVEMFKADKLGSTFFFVDMDYRSKKTGSTTRGVVGAYWEVSRDFTFAKVKDSNVSFTAHGEYNGGLNQTGPFQQCILVGPALQWHNDDFRKTFTFQALYKHMLKGNGVDGHASFQTTAVWGITFANDLCTFSGFADLWYAQTPKNVYKGKQGSDQRGLIFPVLVQHSEPPQREQQTVYRYRVGAEQQLRMVQCCQEQALLLLEPHHRAQVEHLTTPSSQLTKEEKYVAEVIRIRSIVDDGEA